MTAAGADIAVDERRHAVALLVRSIRTGEISARERMIERFADGIELVADGERYTDPDRVADVLSRQWAFTPVLARAHWAAPTFDGETGTVEARCPGLGAAPTHVTLRVEFDGDDRIMRVEFAMQLWDPPVTEHQLPDHVRAAIDHALANGTPMVLSYIGADGAPTLSLRGSVQVSGPLELSMWVRKAGGFVDAIAADPRVSLLYRNSPTRTTLTITGTARVVEGRRRDQVYELSPEVEQLHDPDRTGIAVLIDVDRVRGTSPQGMVLVEPPD